MRPSASGSPHDWSGTPNGVRGLFDFTEEIAQGSALVMTYHLQPWDEPIFKGKTAAISSIQGREEVEAALEFGTFRAWCARHRIKLVSCRLAQDQLTECGFLEQQG